MRVKTDLIKTRRPIFLEHAFRICVPDLSLNALFHLATEVQSGMETEWAPLLLEEPMPGSTVFL